MTARHGLPAPLKKIALSCRRMAFPCNGSGGKSTFTLFSCGVTTRPPNSNGWLIVTSGFFRPCPTSFSVICCIQSTWPRTRLWLPPGGGSRAMWLILVMIHEQVLPLGAVVWAAVGKSLGFTPEGLINEIRRLARYTECRFSPRGRVTRRLIPPRPWSAFGRLWTRPKPLSRACQPTRRGCCFLKDGHVVQPDPDHLDDYTTHAGQRRGHWPTSTEISAAMLEHYKKKRPTPEAT